MQTTTRYSVSFAPVRIGVFVLALAGLLTSFYPQWRYWGIDSLRAFEPPVRFFLVLLLALAIAPGGVSRVGSATMRIATSMTIRQWRVLWAGLVLLLLLSFVVLSSDNHLLGDGFTLLGNTYLTPTLSPTEPLDYLFHHALYAFLPEGESGAIRAYRLCSYLAGLAFLIILYRRVDDKPLLLVILPAILSFPVMQFFFGYVESYTFSFLVIFLYLLNAGRDITQGDSHLLHCSCWFSQLLFTFPRLFFCHH